MIGHTIAGLAKAGLDRLVKVPLVSNTPGLGEFLGVARDAAAVTDLAAQGASRVGDVAEAVGRSKALKALGKNFEKQGKLSS
jgi:hypothetical protein